ncbi:MAG: J domain-containing protein [Fusobacteriaceae bacterium]|jgi:hypothetical protein|nr:J domain-containing protein [Fusobacteriaceae bacterium]
MFLLPGLFYTILFLLLPLIFAYLYGVRIGKSGLPFLIISYGLGLILAYVSASMFNYILALLEIVMIFYAIFKKGSRKGRYGSSRYYKFEGKDQEKKEKNGDGGRNYTAGYDTRTTKGRYLRVLNVSESAGLEEVKRAYRNLIKQHHPDKFMNASQDEKKLHERKMKEINEAYEYVEKLYQ